MEWPTCPPPSSPSPATPAAAETVLPHADIDPTQLANQASHLTLSAVEPGSPSLLASSAAPPPSEPDSEDSPLRQATSCLIEPLSESTSSTPITISTPGPAAAAQPVPHTSHDHTREGLLMRDGRLNAIGQEEEGGNPWPAPGADRDCRELIIPGRTGMDSRPRFVNSNAIARLSDLPNEVLLHILGFLDVPDLLATSRTSHQFRSLAVAPILHRLRLRHVRTILPPLLTSPSRPSLLDLIHRSIFLTHTTVVSRQLARNLTAIRLSRRLAARPPPEALVQRSVLPPECVPGNERVAPSLVAKKRAVEREQVRDGLRRWVGSVFERRWREKVEGRRRWEESRGVGRVWRLRRFWEGVGRGEVEAS